MEHIYYLKVFDFAGTAMTITRLDASTEAFPVPLPVAKVKFQEVSFVPGQHNVGKWSAVLHDVRSPQYAYLQPFYNALDYEQIVEIYDNQGCLGNPVHKGIITARPGDLSERAIEGEGIVRKLANRKTWRNYEYIGTPNRWIPEQFNTYDPTFQDDFDRAAIGADWSIIDGSWDIYQGALRQSTAAGLPYSIDTVQTWGIITGSVSFDFFYPADAVIKNDLVHLVWSQGNHEIYLASNHGNGNISAFLAPDAIYPAERQVSLQMGQWNHLDVFFYRNPSQYGAGIVLNGTIVIPYLYYYYAATDISPFRIAVTIAPGGSPVLIDNFVVSEWNPKFVLGQWESTDQSFTQNFNGASFLEMIEWYCNAMTWTYRIRYRPGLGNDIFDYGTRVGNDYSNVLRVREDRGGDENLRIVDLKADRSSQDLATLLNVYGQSQDEMSANFIVSDLTAFSKYGVIERDLSDERVSSPVIAKLVGEARLAITSQGVVSLSGKFLDEDALIQSASIPWGVGGWGSGSWGEGRKYLSAGDTLWLTSETLNIDRPVTIVAIDRESGTPEINVTFDYFQPLERDKLKMLELKIQQQVRSTSLRNEPETWDFNLVGTPPPTTRRYYYIRGVLSACWIDIMGQDGTANLTNLTIDGVNVTSVFGGPWTITQGSEAHIKDTAYLVNELNHYIEITTDAACLVRIRVVPQSMA